MGYVSGDLRLGWFNSGSSGSGRIALLLSKPIGRTTLLLGRYLGNLLVVALNHIYLVGAVWLILAVKTNIWNYRFLLAIPVEHLYFCGSAVRCRFRRSDPESAALSVMAPVAFGFDQRAAGAISGRHQAA